MAMIRRDHLTSARRGGATRRPPYARGRRLRATLTPYLFVLPVLVYIGALLAYPVVLNILMSFQDRQLSNLVSGPVAWVGTANYRAVLDDPEFRTAAWHSVVYATVSVSIQLVLGLLGALFFARRFRGAEVMRSLFLVSYAIPIVVSAQVFKWMLDGRGLVNWVLSSLHLQSGPVYWLSDTRYSLPAVIAVQVWLGIPFTMVNLLSGLTSVPRELHEAAAIDGADAWRRFRSVTWPLLRPTVLAATILSLIFAFKTFDLVWIATRGGPANSTEILPTLAYRTAFENFMFGRGAAILNVIFAACFVLALAYIFALRREEPAT